MKGEINASLSVRSLSLLNQVHSQLRTAILSGQIPAGDQLIASKIAEASDISRTPVNGALQLLEQEGLVTRARTGVMTVTGLSTARIAELYSVRSLLEGLCAFHAAKNMAEESRQLLTAAYDSYARAAHSGDSAAVDRTGKEFHRCIHTISALAWTIQILGTLQDYIDSFRARTIEIPGRPVDALDEHTRIYDCLMRGESEGAQQAMIAHIQHSYTRSMETGH
jgi:DNA-binding GntR family transcriptional regulator